MVILRACVCLTLCCYDHARPLFCLAQSDVESTLQRISSHKGVLGCIVVNKDGVILKTTCEPETAELHSHLIPQLAGLARNMVRDLDPQNDLEFLRIRSMKQEIMVAPHAEFVLIVIQDLKSEA